MLIFPLLNDLSGKIIHIDMDTFLLQGKSETILSLRKNRLSWEVILGKQVGAVWLLLVATKRELLVSILL